jgi:hypothetical protein
VIHIIKLHYKKLLVEDKIQKIDKGNSKNIELIHALKFLRDAWNLVERDTIRNCFRKAAFKREVI